MLGCDAWGSHHTWHQLRACKPNIVKGESGEGGSTNGSADDTAVLKIESPFHGHDRDPHRNVNADEDAVDE